MKKNWIVFILMPMVFIGCSKIESTFNPLTTVGKIIINNDKKINN